MPTSITLPFVTLDVFTTDRYAGNPLAIVRVPPGQHLTQEQKQIIAREFNYSETVILHESEGDNVEHRIDIFMTDAELPFAGHPSVGTACYLASNLKPDAKDRRLIMKAGVIPYRYDATSATAFLNLPHDVHVHKLLLSPVQVAKTGIPEQVTDTLVGPISFVSIVKGMTFALLELSSIEALSAVSGSMNPSMLPGNLDQPWYTGFLGTKYFVDHGRRADGVVVLSTRMFMNNGLLEDPATGSAASALSAFLAKRLLHKETVVPEIYVCRFEIEQGVDMGRRSKIQTEVTLDGKSGDVQNIVLGGSAVKVMEGTLEI
jgi:PhzF family phenazine biosynthesis protein